MSGIAGHALHLLLMVALSQMFLEMLCHEHRHVVHMTTKHYHVIHKALHHVISHTQLTCACPELVYVLPFSRFVSHKPYHKSPEPLHMQPLSDLPVASGAPSLSFEAGPVEPGTAAPPQLRRCSLLSALRLLYHPCALLRACHAQPSLPTHDT